MDVELGVATLEHGRTPYGAKIFLGITCTHAEQIFDDDDDYGGVDMLILGSTIRQERRKRWMIFGYPFSDVLLSIGVDTRTNQKSIFTP